MPGTIPAARQHLIDDIAKRARALRRPRQSVGLDDFIQLYYRGVDEDDLRATDAASLAAAAAGHLAFGASRKPGQPRVRVFNPTLERDGWESPHTWIEFVGDDMPFLVDSLAVVLSGSGLAIQLMVHPVLRAQRDGRGRLTGLGDSDAPKGRMESWQHIAISRTEDPGALATLELRILATLEDVSAAVEDWPAMRARALEISRSLLADEPGVPRGESGECSEFLEWLADFFRY